jgi:predicted DNA-binding transcriptional regulator AlpA
MAKYSTQQVAKRLGLGIATMSRYIAAGKIPAPPETIAGGMRMRLWSESEIEQLQQLLPKIANGRKTRWQRQRAAAKQSAKAKPKAKKKKQAKKKK